MVLSCFWSFGPIKSVVFAASLAPDVTLLVSKDIAEILLSLSASKCDASY